MPHLPTDSRRLSLASSAQRTPRRRGTILLMVVGLLSMLFVLLSAYLNIARFDRSNREKIEDRREIESVLASAEDFVIDSLSNSLNNTGLGVNVPGTGNARWLAQSEPVIMPDLDPNYGGNWGLNNWPDLNTSGTRSAIDLLRDVNPVAVTDFSFYGSGSDPFRNPVPGAPRAYGVLPMLRNFGGGGEGDEEISDVDLEYVAREGFLDADGDGIPDAGYAQMSPLIELANSVVGSPVTAPNSSQFFPDNNPGNWSVSELGNFRYQDAVRFEVATRVVSHGGMINLRAMRPDVPTSWFNRAMFQYLAEPLQSVSDDDPMEEVIRSNALDEDQRLDGSPTVADFHDLLASEWQDVEMSLRDRGGILPPREMTDFASTDPSLAVRRAPTSLVALEEQFPELMIPDARTDGDLRDAVSDPGASAGLSRFEADRLSQRFDVSAFNNSSSRNPSENDLEFWRRSRALNANAYNPGEAEEDLVPLLRDYSQRQLFTAASTSDEIVRRIGDEARWDDDIDNAEAIYSDDNRFGAGVDVPIKSYGLVEGQLKFYLGKINDALYTSSGVFQGSIDVDDGDGLRFAQRLDPINEAVDYFYDMLAGHQWVKSSRENDLVPEIDQDDSERGRLSRIEQAAMLAVNLAGFAAPTLSDGRATTDVPWYPLDVNNSADQLAPDGDIEAYVFAYTPQPFIAQVGIDQRCVEVEDEDSGERFNCGKASVSSAIVLYNPYDRPLEARDFAISVSHPETATASWTGDFGTDLQNFDSAPNYPTGDRLFPLSVVPGQPGQPTFGLRTSAELPARTFVTLAIEERDLVDAERTNEYFSAFLGTEPDDRVERQDGTTPAPGEPHGLLSINALLEPLQRIDSGEATYGTAEETVAFTLWRQIRVDGARHWIKVDHFEIVISNDASNPELREPDASEFTEIRSRDINSETYFGARDDDDDNSPMPARWRIAAAFREDDRLGPNLALRRSDSGLDDVERDDLGRRFPEPTARRAPTAPLITMNPTRDVYVDGKQEWPVVHGVARPPAFPTVGYLAYVPRYAHVFYTNTGQWVSAPEALANSLFSTPDGNGSAPADALSAAGIPLDFGHMPLFDNTQSPDTDGPLADLNLNGETIVRRVPWGQLIFDYFTTHDTVRFNGSPGAPTPQTADSGADPYQLWGRIDVNVAPWHVLAGLPLIFPGDGISNSSNPRDNLNLERIGAAPEFWDPESGLVTGVARFDSGTRIARTAVAARVQNGDERIATYDETDRRMLPHWDLNVPEGGDYDFRLALEDGTSGGTDGGNGGDYDNGAVPTLRLGAQLAQAIAAHRDQVPYYPPFSDEDVNDAPATFIPFANFRGQSPQDQNGDDVFDDSDFVRDYIATRDTARLGPIPNSPGLSTLGALLNVKGFDGTRFGTVDGLNLELAEGPQNLTENVLSNGTFNVQPAGVTDPLLGDYLKAVSTLTMLDTHFITTRSNTYTAYISVFDRDNPNRSIRTQMTLDRSNLLPRLIYNAEDINGEFPETIRLEQIGGDDGLVPETPVILREVDARPEKLAERRTSFFNSSIN